MEGKKRTIKEVWNKAREHCADVELKKNCPCCAGVVKMRIVCNTAVEGDLPQRMSSAWDDSAELTYFYPEICCDSCELHIKGYANETAGTFFPGVEALITDIQQKAKEFADRWNCDEPHGWKRCDEGAVPRCKITPAATTETAPTKKGAIIDGVGKDAEAVTNAAGGKQSLARYSPTRMPARAFLASCGVLYEGAQEYEKDHENCRAPLGEENWRKIPYLDHLDHALIHIYAHLAGDTQDDHMAHFGARAMLALENYLNSQGGD